MSKAAFAWFKRVSTATTLWAAASTFGALAPLPSVWAAPHHPVSAIRASDHGFLDEALATLPDAGTTDDATPWSVQAPLASVDLRGVPALDDMGQLRSLFERVRDSRDWKWNDQPDFARRIPWLYVDDGCYLRAELSAVKLRAWGVPLPKQVMAFGDLQGDSPYGSVSWWYHVAPILSVAGQAYVLDPAVEAARPLPLRDWIQRMTPAVDAASVSVCNADAVDPYTPCHLTHSDWDPAYETEQVQTYLGLEWNKLLGFLGKEPVDVLGDSPPWKHRRNPAACPRRRSGR